MPPDGTSGRSNAVRLPPRADMPSNMCIPASGRDVRQPKRSRNNDDRKSTRANPYSPRKAWE